MTKANHGGARVGAGRKKKVHTSLDGTKRTPLEYLLDVMNDPAADPLRRLNAAKVAARFVHPRPQPGKKDAAQTAAVVAGKGKFAPGIGPRLIVNNTGPAKGNKP